MKLSELQSQFQVLVPDFPYSSYVAQVLQWFNLAQDIIADFFLIEDEATSDSEAEVGTYNLPETCIEIKRDGVLFDGVHIEPANLGVARREYGDDWMSADPGTPKFFMREGTILTLIPAPLEAGKEITVKFFGYANPLSSENDLPFTTGDATQGYDYHNALRSLDPLLLDYAIGMAKFSLGFYATVDAALKLFYTNLAAKVKLLKRTPHMEIRAKRPDEFFLRKLSRRRNY